MNPNDDLYVMAFNICYDAKVNTLYHERCRNRYHLAQCIFVMFSIISIITLFYLGIPLRPLVPITALALLFAYQLYHFMQSNAVHHSEMCERWSLFKKQSEHVLSNRVKILLDNLNEIDEKDIDEKNAKSINALREEILNIEKFEENEWVNRGLLLRCQRKVNKELGLKEAKKQDPSKNEPRDI